MSLSMTRLIPAYNNPHAKEENFTYHQLAVRGINQFLNYLSRNSKLEYVSLVVYSTLYEIIVDFTRDYEQIKQVLHNIEHYDKANLQNVLQASTSMMLTNWGQQNLSQILVFTDCGIGMNSTCLEKTIVSLRSIVGASSPAAGLQWTSQVNNIKINFICIGDTTEMYFQRALKLYQEFLDLICPNGGSLFALNQDEFGLDMNGECTLKKRRFDMNGDFVGDCALTKDTFAEIIDQLCSKNYGRFEATLKCGDYFKLETAILLWPSPSPVKDGETTKTIKRNLEICGYFNLNDIGSPMSISRHLIIPNNWTSARRIQTSRPHEKMQDSIRTFYAKIDESEDESSSNHSESSHESICVMLHGALKMENMAALTLLEDDWYGLIYSYADSKKKSNLMLTILPPGHDVIPWLGDLRNLGVLDSAAQPGDVLQFPIKPEKRSYSQNCPVWIKQAGLHSDIQKVLRHAKKLPEKTQHFYRELNRIRRAALSMGFIELLDGLANLCQREILALSPNASPDCTIQLTHAANELTKVSNRDLKVVISPLPNKYNQLL